MTAGNSTTYTVTATAVNGFSGSVALSASGLPPGAAASFARRRSRERNEHVDDHDDNWNHHGSCDADHYGNQWCSEPWGQRGPDGKWIWRRKWSELEWKLGIALGNTESDDVGNHGLGALGGCLRARVSIIRRAVDRISVISQSSAATGAWWRISEAIPSPTLGAMGRQT